MVDLATIKTQLLERRYRADEVPAVGGAGVYAFFLAGTNLIVVLACVSLTAVGPTPADAADSRRPACWCSSRDLCRHSDSELWLSADFLLDAAEVQSTIVEPSGIFSRYRSNCLRQSAAERVKLMRRTTSWNSSSPAVKCPQPEFEYLTAPITSGTEITKNNCRRGRSTDASESLSHAQTTSI